MSSPGEHSTHSRLAGFDRAVEVAQNHMPDPSAAAVRRGSETLADLPDRSTGPARLLEERLGSIETLTAANFAAAARSVYADLAGADLPPLPGDNAPPGEPPGGEIAGTDRFGFPGGDLDDDGNEDVLVIEAGLAGPFTFTSLDVRAFAGPNGNPLWHRELDASAIFSAPLPAGDLDGDGSDDVLLWELFVDEDHAESTCAVVACAQELSWSWAFTGLSGPTGEPLWQRTLPGEVTDAFAGVGAVALAFADVFTASNVVAIPLFSDDHDGDGGVDVVIDSWDVTGAAGFVGAPGVSASEGLFLVEATGELVAGADATPLFSRATGIQLGDGFLLPAGNATGNKTGDLLWQQRLDVTSPFVCTLVPAGADIGTGCFFERQAVLDLELVDGNTFETVWEISVDEPGLAYALAAPLGTSTTADSFDDLLLYEEFDEPGENAATSVRIRQAVVDGNDSTRLWTRDTGAFLLPIGPVAGDDGDDLVGFGFRFDEASGTFGLSLPRFDGATGDLLFETTHDAPPESFAFVGGFPGGDGDADGVEDIIVEQFEFDFETGAITSSFLVESGASGGPVYERSSTGSVFAVPVGNQDGLGGDDLVEIGFDDHLTRTDVTLRAVRLPQGRAAWERTDTLASASAIAVVPSAPALKTPGDDLVYTRGQLVDDHVTSRVDLLDGLTGRASWGVGDDRVAPPLPATGAIAGSVAGPDDAPLEACVSAWDTDGNFTGSTLTAGDGTYLLDDLPLGEHRVLFEDCGDGTLASEWFDDRPDFANADPVVVDDGETTAGIDAVLEAPTVSNDFGTKTGETQDNQVDCGTSDGTETVGVDDIGGTGLTVRVDGTTYTDGAVVVCNDDASLPLQGRIYVQGSGTEPSGSMCADGDADNPGAYSTWACIMSDRDGDGISDIGCGGPDDSTNSADPDNTADLESC